MTAPVRIEACAWTDVRYQALATMLDLPSHLDAIIRVATIWRWQTEHYTDEAPTYVVSTAVVIGALGMGGPEAIVAADLAELQPDGKLRIRGGYDAQGKSRIDWLWRDRQVRREKGLARANQARTEGRAAGGRFQPRQPDRSDSQPDTSREPSDVQPDSSRTPAEHQVSVSVSVSGLRDQPPKPPKGGSFGSGPDRPVSKPKSRVKSDLTEDELAVAQRVLSKISERTGVGYGRDREHLRLIAARLRDGVTERDLRAVIAFAWDPSGLGWSVKEIDGQPMKLYLRPETLFGPKKIAQYLAPARAWLDEHYPTRLPPPAPLMPVEGPPADLPDLFRRHREAS